MCPSMASIQGLVHDMGKMELRLEMLWSFAYIIKEIAWVGGEYSRVNVKV